MSAPGREKVQAAPDLPYEQDAESLPEDYYLIDFVVPDYTQGTGSMWAGSDLEVIGLFVRPKVVLASRLREGKSGAIKYQTQATKQMSPLGYLADSIDLKSVFRLGDRDEETFDRLMLECLLENMSQIRAHLS